MPPRGGRRKSWGVIGCRRPTGQEHPTQVRCACPAPPIPTFKADAFRFRPLFSLLLSESESLSILSLVAAVVTAVTAMTARASSSSLPPAGSASGASLSEELTG